MMKRLFLLLTSFVWLSSFPIYAQTKITYSEVVSVENASAKELYARANNWFNSTYVDVAEILEVADTAKGQFEGKPLMKFNPTVYTRSEETKGSIRYTIKVYVKEGRYKYEMSNFFHNPNGIRYGTYSMGLITQEKECPNSKPENQAWSNKVWLDIKKQIDKEMKRIILSLKDGLENPPEDDNVDTMGDDW